jgi:type VI secretion system protein
VDAAALDLDLLYASWRGAWEHLRNQMEQVLGGLEGPARTAALRKLAEKYAAVAGEPAFREMGGAPAPAGAHRPPSGSFRAPAPSSGSGGGRLLTAFAEAYLPPSVKLAEAEVPQQVLGRVADVLETFARSYVEMRKGYEEFGREMGVRTIQGNGPVEQARDPKQLLAYLLDPSHPTRSRDLQAAFADLMVHQVALLNGVVEGAKALLEPLDPEAIQEASPGGIWPMKAQALWKVFVERYQELQDEDSAIEEKLFGRRFARAYTSMLGQRGDAKEAEEPDDDDDRDQEAEGEEEEEDERPPPRRRGR